MPNTEKPEIVDASVEYRVVPVTRYQITKKERIVTANGDSGGVRTLGEYENGDVAWEVAYALCKADHERLGYPPADERVQYPLHPRHLTAEPEAAAA